MVVLVLQPEPEYLIVVHRAPGTNHLLHTIARLNAAPSVTTIHVLGECPPEQHNYSKVICHAVPGCVYKDAFETLTKEDLPLSEGIEHARARANHNFDVWSALGVVMDSLLKGEHRRFIWIDDDVIVHPQKFRWSGEGNSCSQREAKRDSLTATETGLSNADYVGCVSVTRKGARLWRDCILGFHATRSAAGYCMRNYRLTLPGRRKDTRTASDSTSTLSTILSDDPPSSVGSPRLPASRKVRNRIAVVMASMPRFDWILNQTLQRLNSLEKIGPIHVFGHCPPLGVPKVVCHPFPNNTAPKRALGSLLDDEVPQIVLTKDGGPFSLIDHVSRARWRSSIALDTWAVLGAALPFLGANQDFLWMENDVYAAPLTPGAAPGTVSSASSGRLPCAPGGSHCAHLM